MAVPTNALLCATFVALAAGKATSTAGRGFAPKPVSTTPRPRAPPSGNFEEWAAKGGIKPQVPLSVAEFDGERGVAADADIAAGATILTVPAKLAIQTNTLSKPPRWCDEAAWRACKWDARLAMLLLTAAPKHSRWGITPTVAMTMTMTWMSL